MLKQKSCRWTTGHFPIQKGNIVYAPHLICLFPNILNDALSAVYFILQWTAHQYERYCQNPNTVQLFVHYNLWQCIGVAVNQNLVQW